MCQFHLAVSAVLPVGSVVAAGPNVEVEVKLADLVAVFSGQQQKYHFVGRVLLPEEVRPEVLPVLQMSLYHPIRTWLQYPMWLPVIPTLYF